MEDLDNYEVGQPIDIPMTPEQRYRIDVLLQTCVFDESIAEGYRIVLDCGLTTNEADGIIEELRKHQLDDYTLANDGRLKEKPLAAVIRRIVRFPNT